MQFGDTRRRLAPALIDADHPHAKGGGKPRDFAADPADADDQRRRLGQVDDALILRRLLPLAAQLLRNVTLQAAREGQHKGHHMGADMVVIYFAEIGDLDGVGDQLRIIIAGGRCRLRRLQPFEIPRPAQ